MGICKIVCPDSTKGLRLAGAFTISPRITRPSNLIPSLDAPRAQMVPDDIIRDAPPTVVESDGMDLWALLRGRSEEVEGIYPQVPIGLRVLYIWKNVKMLRGELTTMLYPGTVALHAKRGKVRVELFRKNKEGNCGMSKGRHEEGVPWGVFSLFWLFFVRILAIFALLELGVVCVFFAELCVFGEFFILFFIWV